jgi:hypothetical protein
MLKALKYIIYVGFLAGLGILLGCYIHGKRVNQTTLMSGVAFVRELPYGEHIVGYTETYVFSYQEKKHYQEYMEKHGDNIKIDPKVLERHKQLLQGAGKK